ncbi:MAG: hypothetical protein WBA74_01200 [Cyclobacteriaceae bacterium]
MKKLPERLGLVEEAQVTLDISKQDFMTLLADNLDPYRYALFEAFTSSHNLYKGKLIENGFIIRKKRKILQSKSAHIRITGIVEDSEYPTQIRLHLESWSNKTLLLYIFFLLCYLFAFTVIFQSDAFSTFGIKIIAVIVLTLHMMLLFSAPIITLRKSVKRMCTQVVADLHMMVMRQHRQYKS